MGKKAAHVNSSSSRRATCSGGRTTASTSEGRRRRDVGNSANLKLVPDESQIMSEGDLTMRCAEDDSR